MKFGRKLYFCINKKNYMKKILLFFFCVLFSLTMQAQKVLGVEFGSTIEEVNLLLKVDLVN